MRCFDLQGPSRGRQVTVLPVPFEGAVSYGGGASLGPQAFLEASCQIESYDPELDLDLADLAHFAVLPPVSGPTAAAVQAAIAHVLQSLDPRQDLVFLIGGDHSVPFPLMAWYHAAFPELTVLHLDAHADLRDRYEGTPLSHACILRRAQELGVRAFQLGLRSVCPEEMALLRCLPKDSWRARFAWELGSPEAMAAEIRAFVGRRPLYITFDVDAMDPCLVPGTGTPEPGGMSYRWLQEFWRALWQGAGPRLVGLDVCELAPIAGSQVSQTVVAKVVQRLLLTGLRGEGA